MQMHRLIFTVSMTGISRALVLRDRMLGRIRPRRLGPERFGDSVDALVTQCTIPSGSNLLDAVFVTPAARPVESAVLICHGIGEVVEHWVPVQRLLAAHGAASLVFDYSGYGRSTGRIDAEQWELDAIAAFEHLQRPMPSHAISLLGFSMGTGVATSIVNRVAAERLILCAGFPSFRAAAFSLGIPREFSGAIPHLWHAEEALRNCRVPVLVVHGERDRLFPVPMASELKAFCGEDSELIVVPELGHNEPFYQPRLAYWGLILKRLAPQGKSARPDSREGGAAGPGSVE